MHPARFFRNIVFAVVLLVLVSSIGEVDLPITDDLEEYIAFVLTTDFDFGVWWEELRELASFDTRVDWGELWRGWTGGPAEERMGVPDPDAAGAEPGR